MTSRKCGKCGVEVSSVNIYVCPKGHVSCVTCKEKRCSECWRSGRNERKRNKVMKVADKEKIPCQNAKRGCPVKIPKGDPHKHETECLFNGLYFNLCENVGFDCKHMMSPIEIDNYLQHLIEKHDAKMRPYVTSCTVSGLDENPTTEGFRTTEYLGMEPTILKVDGEPQAGTKGGCTYFLVVSGCTDEYFHYICVHLGPLGTRVLTDYQLDVELRSHNPKVRSLRIKPEMLDIGDAGRLNQEHATLYQVEVDNLRSDYADSKNLIHEKLIIKKATDMHEPLKITKYCFCGRTLHAARDTCDFRDVFECKYQCELEFAIRVLAEL